jgi:hypothetical protein
MTSTDISTTDTAPMDNEITAQDTRALRSADKIVYRRYNGQDTIEATRDGAKTADGFDQSHTVYVGGMVQDYERQDGWPAGRREYQCFEMCHSAQYSNVNKSALARIAKGDRVALVWTAGNNNDLVRDANLHVDMLTLSITKPNGKREHYLLDVSVSRDNTARMVRRVR